MVNDDSIYLLKECDAGTKMAVTSIDEILEKVELPVLNVTSCCFGGEKLDELYITTSSLDSPEKEYPLAGSLLMIKPGVRGMKVNRYKL